MKKLYHICKTTAGILGTTGGLERLPGRYTNNKISHSKMRKLQKENKDKRILFFIEFDWIK